MGFDPSFCPIYAQCKRSQSFTPVIDERLRQIESQMLTASGIRENSLLDMIFVVEGPRRCHLEEQMQAVEEQRPEEHRRSKAACLRAELRILETALREFRELQTRNRGFFVPADLILQAQIRERQGTEWVIKTRTGMAISAPWQGRPWRGLSSGRSGSVVEPRDVSASGEALSLGGVSGDVPGCTRLTSCPSARSRSKVDGATANGRSHRTKLAAMFLCTTQ